MSETSADLIIRVPDIHLAAYKTAWSGFADQIFPTSKGFVLFDTQGGTAVEMIFLATNEAISKPIAPRRGNYIFAGWYTDINFINKFDFNTIIDRDFILYAKWDYEFLEVDTITSVDMNSFAGETFFFEFTPTTSGYFTIRSYGALATTGILYNSAGSQLTSNSNGGSGIAPNFLIRYQFTANVTYIIGVRLTTTTAVGEFTIQIYNG